MRSDKANGRRSAPASGGRDTCLLRWVLSASLLLGAVSAQAALQARDLNGDTVTDAYYDTELDITWLREFASLNGNWHVARDWAESLTFGGYTDWRLPTMIDTADAGCDGSFGGTDCGYNVQTKSGDTIYSELAHLFHVTLGNLSRFDESGIGRSDNFGPDGSLKNRGPFLNVQPALYWSGLELSTQSGIHAWTFDFGAGQQLPYNKIQGGFAVAVRSGDVAASVPEPQALALALLALGAAGVARRQRPR